MKLPIEQILQIRAKDSTTLEAEWIGEIVRCKDCRKYGTQDCAMSYSHVDDYGNIDEDVSWNNINDYCSWGERRP